ncbi:MAG: hypothetical protein N2235_21050 [Fischerella sp.]|nr:hypothetical protein [Fischerella sp.]
MSPQAYKKAIALNLPQYPIACSQERPMSAISLTSFRLASELLNRSKRERKCRDAYAAGVPAG